jgi:hypothetical protein
MGYYFSKPRSYLPAPPPPPPQQQQQDDYRRLWERADPWNECLKCGGDPDCKDCEEFRIAENERFLSFKAHAASEMNKQQSS